MKKIISLLLCCFMVLSYVCVFADEVNETKAEEVVNISEEATDVVKEEPSVSEEKTEDAKTPAETEKETVVEEVAEEVVEKVLPNNTSNKVYINFKMLPKMVVVDSFAKIKLTTKDGKVLGEKVEWVGGITEELNFEFDVPEYKLGESFILTLQDGLNYIKYYDDVIRKDETVKLDTYGYENEDGEYVKGDSFSFEACPMYTKGIVVYLEGKKLNLSPYGRLIDNVTMVPVRPLAEAMGLDVKYDEKYNSVVCSVGDKQAIFNIGQKYATILGEDIFMAKECMEIEDIVFVPVRTLVEAFKCELSVPDFDDHLDIIIGKSPVIEEYYMQIPVNKNGITSRTNWLVWVDKSDYRVRVYNGSQYRWKQVASFPCAIGAPGTPTVTGSFEYLYRVSSWTYPGYYVGPCLVFYRGYALHSTLLQYNGVPYDNRVGVMISHGCVRLHKSDIDWIAARLPLNSRIYVTE